MAEIGNLTAKVNINDEEIKQVLEEYTYLKVSIQQILDETELTSQDKVTMIEEVLLTNKRG